MEALPSLTLRVASGADSLAVARVHIAAWRVAYRGIIPDSYLNDLDEEARASRYTFDRNGPGDPLTWIALRGEQIMGFVTLGPARDDALARGEIFALYVAPQSWRSGIGSALMARAEEQLVSDGFDEASLLVLRDNTRGRHFYEAAGWRCAGGDLTAQFDGQEVVEVQYVKALRRIGAMSH
jgi:ribosomal protein S18 acetylase RimI-like enzyme